MAFWRYPLRFGLALLVAGVGAAVLLNLRGRADPAPPLAPVDRTDREATIEVTGSQTTQTDALGDNIRVVAGRQFTYPDGGLRMEDGVEVTVAERDGRDGFVLRSASATIDAGQTEVVLGGGVELIAGDLEAGAPRASYSEADGVVRMPEAATFRRGDMRAAAASAEYQRTTDRLQLAGRATVTLSGGGPETEADAPTTIDAESATIDYGAGRMRFGGSVSIDAGSLAMEAPRARADLVPDTSQIEMLVLGDGVRVTGRATGAGQLRAMSAADVELRYADGGGAAEQAALSGDARVALSGAVDDAGAEIAAASMAIAFGADGSGLSSLTARDDVSLELPAREAAPGRRIAATALSVEGLAGEGPEQALFEGAVEYREPRGTDGAARVGRAERLEATLAGGLSSLESAVFRGGVTFEDGDVLARGDEARYLIADEAVEIGAPQPAEQPQEDAAAAGDAEDEAETGGQPEVVYAGGTVRAGAIRVGFDGPQIAAQGSVGSVLRRSSGNADETGGAEYPGLVDGGEPLLVTAEELAYDGAERVVTYTGGAHLWQGETTFKGDELVLDEASGDLTIEGSAETTFAMTRVDRESGEPQTSLSTGSAESMRYEKALHRVTYASGARLDGPQGDLQAEEIEAQLQADDATLDRVTASEDVTLLAPGRVVSGDRLVYHDAAGRYEMEGAPVEFVETVDEGCRETRGRAITFFASADDISVDGQYQRRTATASGACPEQLSR